MLQKKLLHLFWEPLFVGAPVLPNMLNMPKSADGTIRYMIFRLMGYMVINASSGSTYLNGVQDVLTGNLELA